MTKKTYKGFDNKPLEESVQEDVLRDIATLYAEGMTEENIIHYLSIPEDLVYDYCRDLDSLAVMIRPSLKSPYYPKLK